MARKKGQLIPTNMIVGFLGSGKTTAIKRLLEKRPSDEQWSVLINEFGTVSIDQALVDADKGIAVEELGGGCACCTLEFAFKPLLAQFLRRTKPDRFILEPSGLSHPAKVIDILRSPNFAGAIDLRNIICLIDPKDFDDPRWRETQTFYDQIHLADIVVLNWSDKRERDVVDRCREWVDSFRPPKQLIVETSFGEFDSTLLDLEFDDVRFPLFADAHPSPKEKLTELTVLKTDLSNDNQQAKPSENEVADTKPSPGRPLRFQNNDSTFDACGWIFHVDDVFDRDRLLDLLGYVSPIVRLKGVFRCENDWWMINRAKDGTSYARIAYRRDSRLEIILEGKTSGWSDLEAKILQCLANFGRSDNSV